MRGLIVPLLVGGVLLAPKVFAAPTSVYTSLKTTDCKTLESNTEEAGWYRGRCKGVAGYQLDLLEGDLRQSINIIAPNGQVSKLNLWQTVSSGFSTLGDKAEWLIIKQGEKRTPQALIVRFNASEDSENATKITSYLVVSKITPNRSCVVDIIAPQSGQNTLARQRAATAATRACKA